MKRCHALVALLLVPSWGWSADKESLRAYVDKTKGRQAFGAYLQGKKIGWMVVETILTKHDGKEIAQTNEEFTFDLRRGDDTIGIQAKGITRYSLEGDGEVLFSEDQTTQKSNGKASDTVRIGTLKGKEFVITTRINGKTTSRTVKPPRKNLRSAQQLDRWLESSPKKGDTFEAYTLSLEDANPDVKETYQFVAKKRIVWGGVPTNVYQVVIESRGSKSETEMLADGTPIRGQVGGILEIRAEPEEVAKKLDAEGFDLMRASSIVVDKDIGNPQTIEKLTLEIRELGDFALPQSHRQRLRKDGDRQLLELRRDFRVDKAEPLTDQARAGFLQATPAIQKDEEEIKKLVDTLVGQEKDTLKKVGKLKDWVYRNLRKTMDANATTAIEVLDNKAGDCTEHTLLFVTLARAAGIPAREVGGVAFVQDEKPLFGWHAWAEIHDGHQWVSVDPTWNQVYVDGTHIKFSEGEEDWAWLNVLGRVQVKVVKFSKK